MVGLDWFFKHIVDLEHKLLPFESLSPVPMLDVALVVVFLKDHRGTILFYPLSVVSAGLIHTFHVLWN